MFDADRDLLARQPAFAWLDAKLATGQSELSRAELESFAFEGEPLKLVDQSRGVRNPRRLAATINVMTGANSPYADEPVSGGLIRYDYRSGEGGDNVNFVLPRSSAFQSSTSARSGRPRTSPPTRST